MEPAGSLMELLNSSLELYFQGRLTWFRVHWHSQFPFKMSSEEIDGFDDTSGIRITDIPHVDLKETSNVTLGSRYLSTTPQSHSQQSSLSSELPSTTLSSPVSDKKGEPSTVIQENILPVIDAVQEPEPLPNGFWDHKSILTCGKPRTNFRANHVQF